MEKPTGDVAESFVSYTESGLHATAFVRMDEMRRKKHLCDITLQSSDGQTTYDVHRIVLATTIPYFETTFNRMFCDNRTSEDRRMMTLPEMDQSALERLIEFAYTGSVRIDDRNMAGLLVATKVMRLRTLHEVCAKYTKSRINIGNVLKLRSVGDSVGAPDLVGAADQFIVGTVDRTLFDQPEFGQLRSAAILSLCRIGGDAAANVDHRIEVAIRWIKHDEHARSALLTPILQHLPLGRATPQFLTGLMAREPWIDFESMRLIVDAMKHDVKGPPVDRSAAGHPSGHRPRTTDDRRRIYVLDRRSNVHVFNTTSRSVRRVDGAKCPLRGCLHIAPFAGWIYAFDNNNRMSKFDVKAEKWSPPVACAIDPHAGAAAAASAAAAAGPPPVNECIFFWSPLHDGIRCFCPKTEAIAEIAPMLNEHPFCTLVTLGGFVYAIGGRIDGRMTNCVERYDPAGRTWTSVAPMREKRNFCAAATLDGRLFVCGGFNTVCQEISSAEVFDPKTQDWTFIAPMNECRALFSLVALRGKLWAIGDDRAEVYDPSCNRWTDCDKLSGIDVSRAVVLGDHPKN